MSRTQAQGRVFVVTCDFFPPCLCLPFPCCGVKHPEHDASHPLQFCTCLLLRHPETHVEKQTLPAPSEFGCSHCQGNQVICGLLHSCFILYVRKSGYWQCCKGTQIVQPINTSLYLLAQAVIVVLWVAQNVCENGLSSGFCAICSHASSNLSLHGVLGWLNEAREGLFTRDSSSRESHPTSVSCPCKFLYSNCTVPLSAGFVLWPLALSPAGLGSRLPKVSAPWEPCSSSASAASGGNCHKLGVNREGGKCVGEIVRGEAVRRGKCEGGSREGGKCEGRSHEGGNCEGETMRGGKCEGGSHEVRKHEGGKCEEGKS